MRPAPQVMQGENTEKQVRDPAETQRGQNKGHPFPHEVANIPTAMSNRSDCAIPKVPQKYAAPIKG